MLIKDVLFELKDGRKAILRSPREGDIPGMLEYLVKTAAETEFLLRYPEECKKYTYEAEKEMFDRVNASEYDAFIVCTVEGRIAGNAHLMLKSNLKTKHRASVAIALYKEFWNFGIGTKLFEEIIRIAREKGIMQLELEFIEGNDRARHLYEKMGFKIVSVHPDAICLKDGRFLDEYVMIRKMMKENVSALYSSCQNIATEVLHRKQYN